MDRWCWRQQCRFHRVLCRSQRNIPRKYFQFFVTVVNAAKCNPRLLIPLMVFSNFVGVEFLLESVNFELSAIFYLSVRLALDCLLFTRASVLLARGRYHRNLLWKEKKGAFLGRKKSIIGRIEGFQLVDPHPKKEPPF